MIYVNQNICRFVSTRKSDDVINIINLVYEKEADFKKEYIILDELKPRKFGDWNGQTVSQLLDKYPEGFVNLLNNPDETMGDAESSEQLVARVKSQVEDLVAQNVGNRIIVVTHPEIIQAAICAALDIPADKLSKIFIRTGSATQISYFDDWASLVYSDYTPL